LPALAQQGAVAFGNLYAKTKDMVFFIVLPLEAAADKPAQGIIFLQVQFTQDGYVEPAIVPEPVAQQGYHFMEDAAGFEVGQERVQGAVNAAARRTAFFPSSVLPCSLLFSTAGFLSLFLRRQYSPSLVLVSVYRSGSGQGGSLSRFGMV